MIVNVPREWKCQWICVVVNTSLRQRVLPPPLKDGPGGSRVFGPLSVRIQTGVYYSTEITLVVLVDNLWQWHVYPAFPW